MSGLPPIFLIVRFEEAPSERGVTPRPAIRALPAGHFDRRRRSSTTLRVASSWPCLRATRHGSSRRRTGAPADHGPCRMRFATLSREGGSRGASVTSGAVVAVAAGAETGGVETDAADLSRLQRSSASSSRSQRSWAETSLALRRPLLLLLRILSLRATGEACGGRIWPTSAKVTGVFVQSIRAFAVVFDVIREPPSFNFTGHRWCRWFPAISDVASAGWFPPSHVNTLMDIHAKNFLIVPARKRPAPAPRAAAQEPWRLRAS